MAEKPSSTSVGGGEYEEWNRIWSALPEYESMLYLLGAADIQAAQPSLLL